MKRLLARWSVPMVAVLVTAGSVVVAQEGASFDDTRDQRNRLIAQATQQFQRDLLRGDGDNREQALENFNRSLERILREYDQKMFGAKGRTGDEDVYGYSDSRRDRTNLTVTEMREELDDVQARIDSENRRHQRIVQDIRSAEGSSSNERIQRLLDREDDRHETALSRLTERRDQLREQIQDRRTDNEPRGDSLLDRLERELGD